MKNLRLALVAMLFAVLSVFSANKAQAQQRLTLDQVNTAVGNLIALQGVNVAVNAQDVITIGNITVTDVIDVTNVLNNNNVQVLTDFLNNNTITIDNVLNNLLREADILNNNQIVVGILNGVLLVAQRAQVR